MKLTIFSQHFWPEKFRINDLALKLKNFGITVNVFTGKPNYPSGVIEKKFRSFIPINDFYREIDILRFPIISRGKSSFFKLIINYLSYILSLSVFSFFYKKKFGDIFFVYATSPIFQVLPAIFLGKIFKIPVVIWVQDLWPHNLIDTGYIKNSNLVKVLDFLIKKIYDNSDLILGQSTEIVNEIKKKTKTKVYTFYNPSNYEFFKKQNPKKNFFYNIYYAGNLGFGQSFDNIIEAFNSDILKKEKIRLLIYGSGKNFLLIKKKIKKLNLKNVLLYKSINSRKLKKKLIKANCFLLKLNNGIGLSKTIPAKFQTYLSFGKPMLVINNGIVGKIVKKNKIGFVCNSDSQKKFIDNVINLKKLSVKNTVEIYNNSRKLFIKSFEINNSCKILKKYLETLL